MLVTAACAPREWLLPKIGIESPKLWDYPEDFKPPVSSETNQPMPGFGGSGKVTRTPMIFIHGNTGSATYWLPAREYFLKNGYKPQELWALSYGWNNVRYFDSGDLSVPSVDRIVNGVTDYLSQKSGRRIHQVDMMGHSLGVTLVRQWMKQTNSWHRVRSFIGAAGANQGTWASRPDSRGQNRVVTSELNPGSPWLKQLNSGGETPGPTRYMTLYDGSGWSDVFFASWQKDSSALAGAHNVAYNVEHKTHLDHLELPRVPETMDVMLEWLGQAQEPLPQMEPPQLLREGATVKANQEDALVYCQAGGGYPTVQTAAAASVDIGNGELHTCFARSGKSLLSSPMARYKFSAAEPKAEPLTLTVTPNSGVFEEPQFVELKASDPDAFIVYNTASVPVESGSPLYTEPVYVAGPLTLTAQAIHPDGRVSEPIKLEFDISLELIEARHTLQRQFEPDAPVKYEGKRKVGR